MTPDEAFQQAVEQRFQEQRETLNGYLEAAYIAREDATEAQPNYSKVQKRLRKSPLFKHQRREIQQVVNRANQRRTLYKLRATYGITWWHPAALGYRLTNLWLRLHIIVLWLRRLAIPLLIIAATGLLIWLIIYLIQTYGSFTLSF